MRIERMCMLRRLRERRTHLAQFTVTPRNELEVDLTDTETLLQAPSNVGAVSCSEMDNSREHLRNGDIPQERPAISALIT